MNKPLLILQPDQFTSFTSYYLESYWKQFFNIQIYDPNKTYDRVGTGFVFWCGNADDDLPSTLKDRGYSVLIDNLWECLVDRRDFYWIQHPYWFWLNESLWWQSLGHNEYQPRKKSFLKLALMPIRRKTTKRDYFVNQMKPHLDQIIWSYGETRLPGDADPSHGEYQRFVNFDWYDDTFCSVVIETMLDTDVQWVTEKSMRPMAFYHPYMILSSPGTLKLIRQMGFETFGEIFDESYDDETQFSRRCDLIIDNINGLIPGSYDAITQEKLQHNRDHFYNTGKIKNMIEKEIVWPILEHLNEC